MKTTDPSPRGCAQIDEVVLRGTKMPEEMKGAPGGSPGPDTVRSWYETSNFKRFFDGEDPAAGVLRTLVRGRA